MVAKGISMDYFSENGVGRWSNNYTSEEPMNCSESSPILLPKHGSVFLRTTSFVLKTDYFTRILT